MVNQETLDLIARLPEALQLQVMELIERAASSEDASDFVRELEFLLGVQASESSFGEWQDTEKSFLAADDQVPEAPPQR